MRFPLMLAAAVAAVLLAPTAAASFTLTVTPPDPPEALEEGESSPTLTFDVAIESTGNIVCTNAATLPVVLTLGGVDPPTFNGTLDKEAIDFEIPAGAHLAGADTNWSGSDSAGLTATIGPGITSDHNHTYTVEASYDGTAPEGCQGDFGSASDSGDLAVPVLAPAGDDGDGGSGDGGGGGGGDGNGTDDDPEESPILPAPVVVLAVVLVALLRRRS